MKVRQDPPAHPGYNGKQGGERFRTILKYPTATDMATPKMRSELLTGKYGLITDCLAEFCKEMRKYDYSHDFDTYFRLNKDFNKRDEIAVRKTFSGLSKLLFPDENIPKDYAEMRVYRSSHSC